MDGNGATKTMMGKAENPHLYPTEKTDMKKLMFAAAVAALSTATIADVVSSSVVGYQNKGLNAGYAFNLTVATFQAVGKDADEMTLGDITASEDWQTGTDEIKTLKANGAVDKAYTYVTKALAEEAGIPQGWYLTDDINDDAKAETIDQYLQNDAVLPLGNGLLVLVGLSTTTLTYAGQVLEADQPISLNAGYAFNITGNISPANITLGDITGSEDWQTGTDELKTLKSNGAVDKAYTFVTTALATEAGIPAGWYLTDDINDDSKAETIADYLQNNVAVSAGEAFIVLVGLPTTTITIPSAL